MNRSTSQAILVMLTGFLILFGGGTSGCKPHSEPTHKVGIYVPPSGLTLANIYIDPANSTGCAADLPGSGSPNWGTSATCTGNNGPLKSWWGLANGYWGCANIGSCAPRLRQNTTVTFLSAHTDNTDPVYATPMLEGGAAFGITGAKTAICTGALTASTALNRATPQLWNMTLPASCTGLVVAGQLIVNATHAGEATLYKVVSGLNWAISQPMTTATMPLTINPTPAEVTTWTTGDTVTVYSVPNIAIRMFAPTGADSIGTNYALGNLSYLTIWGGPTFAATYIGDNVLLQDVAESTSYIAAKVSAPLFADMCTNCYVTSGLTSTAPPQFPFAYNGGIVANSSNGFIRLLNDAIVNTTAIFDGPAEPNGLFGAFYLESGKTLTLGGAGSWFLNGASTIVYGPGTLNVAGASRVVYTAGASKAAATFLSTLTLNGQTKYLTSIPSAGTGITVGNTTLTAANLDTSFGATSGCALSGTSAICNY